MQVRIKYLHTLNKLEKRAMTSIQTTIQFKQLATSMLVDCNVATSHSWAPITDSNLFGRGYNEPRTRVLGDSM